MAQGAGGARPRHADADGAARVLTKAEVGAADAAARARVAQAYASRHADDVRAAEAAERARVAQASATAVMDEQRCSHRVLHEIDGLDGWYRCQNRECGWIFEFPVTMKAHTPSDIRAMIGWFERELAR